MTHVCSECIYNVCLRKVNEQMVFDICFLCACVAICYVELQHFWFRDPSRGLGFNLYFLFCFPFVFFIWFYMCKSIYFLFAYIGCSHSSQQAPLGSFLPLLLVFLEISTIGCQLRFLVVVRMRSRRGYAFWWGDVNVAPARNASVRSTVCFFTLV